DILSIIYNYNFRETFPEEVHQSLKKIPNKVKESDLKGRRDLRKDLIITIDGIDAKDLDDAVRVLKLPNKNYLLGVYIADVSYYVTLNSPIDLEARERGTSLYVVDRVIPMLPHKLSNGICSLNPGEDRLVIACEMEINNQGKVVDYEIFPGVINSKYRMNYSDVNKILEENNKKLQEKYNEIVPMLKDMEALAKILKENRIKRGAIDFLSDEAVITVDEKGLPINIEPRIQRTGEKIIEEFMIRANETVTEHFHWLDVPFIYRIHETPKEKKIEHFLNFVKLTGHKLPKKINLTNPKSLQEVLTSLETSEIYPVFSELLLRAMQKACYSEKNVGHFGLASKYYTHFTAPIRRYPDLIVHRLIRDYIFNGEAKTDWDKLIPPIAEHASIQEREAIECEREVEDMKKAEYMKSHVGEVFEGIISGVTGFGFFARLPNTIEGLVHILDLNDDYYYFDEKTLSLIGEKKKKRYRIGDKVKVKVINASKIDLTIDFTVV
ncbi:MAG TPA: ribonuclease R, partial [Tenericutes bacterium]|nr:ribonuclease R [Mycoplasmatota bacterium]